MAQLFAIILFAPNFHVAFRIIRRPKRPKAGEPFGDIALAYFHIYGEIPEINSLYIHLPSDTLNVSIFPYTVSN